MDQFRYVCLVGFLSCVYSSIVIKEIIVPEAISVNGTVDFADFDCIYEATNESGIEVKWFFNNDHDQIYQWIPGFNNSGTGMGILQDRLDANHRTTNESDTEFRGFRIKNIDRELTGNYTCKISGDTHEVSATRHMIIYTPAKSDLEVLLLNSDGMVICTVSGISPEPTIDFYIRSENGSRIDIGEKIETEEDKDGFFNMTATHDFKPYNDTLTGPTTFVCDVTIPGTSYYLTKALIHLGTDDYAVTNVTVEEEAQNTTTGNKTLEEIVFDTPRDDSTMLRVSATASLLLAALMLLLK